MTASIDCTKLDDKALVQLMIQDHEPALSELYDRYGRLIFSVAHHIVGSGVLAEEITFDVFQRTWDKAHTYRANRAKVRTWMVSMARNRAIDVLRREGVRPEHNSLSWTELIGEPTARGNSPETAVALTLRRQKVRSALTELPDEQRQVLALAYFGGYSHSQIAEECDLPLGTVKTRIRLGMKKLRHLLQDI